ncbi:MAG: hypothetical protein LBE84_05670 [Planctomycetota bacterium]|jgi:hypothetical protein|nr:hypothetical protein [Planctomycetota bacterium]
MSKHLRFFIGGIIQGSLPDGIHSQDYRKEIAVLLRNAFPGAEVFDPIKEYPDSLSYNDAKGEAAFRDLMRRAGECDVLVAFIPEASMGTAIELWNASRNGALVVAVSGLKRNWVVRFLSDRIVPDLPALKKFILDGGLADAVAEKDSKRPSEPDAAVSGTEK